jgi:general secretion pathway protein E
MTHLSVLSKWSIPEQDMPYQAEEQIPVAMPLGQYLLKSGKVNADALENALRLSKASGERLGVILIKLGLVSEQNITNALATLLKVPLIKASDYPDVPLYEEQISAKFLKAVKVLPIHESEDELFLAMAVPQDTYVISACGLACGKRVRACIGNPSEILAAIDRLYGNGKTALDQIVEDIEERQDGSEQEDIERLKDLASEAPIVRLVNLLINRAIESRASDIHIEPFENRLKVRYRIDGVLHEVEAPPARSTAAVISRIKIMAKLNIAERRLAQDGRIQLRVQGKEIDLRISTIPTLYGESVVMRILDKQSVVFDFKALGFGGDTLKSFLEVLELPHGILLVTGPTGSGKTSTLYATLRKLNTADSKLITVEDPVEYQLEGVNQMQVMPQIGLTFANALRSIVRQDPDVIMIGEIRDLETAEIAVQSALTGHLVLSTLHTNDAGSSLTRLLDMGGQDYLLTSTINGILAQRLVRMLCIRCRRPYEALPEVIEEMQLARFTEEQPVRLYQAVGCDHCANTGFWGRTAIMEFLVMSDPIRRLVLKHADAGELQQAAIESGMQTMYQDGLCKALNGITTIEEVLRVTHVS